MSINMLELKSTITKLLLLLKEYNDGQISYQIDRLEDILSIINSNETEDIKEGLIKEMFESIYPSRGGLTDFYVWKEDPKERIVINRPISELNDKLWSLLKR